MRRDLVPKAKNPGKPPLQFPFQLTRKGYPQKTCPAFYMALFLKQEIPMVIDFGHFGTGRRDKQV